MNLRLAMMFQPTILLALALMAIIVMMILPMPAWVLDAGLAASFALAILRYDAFDMRFVFRTGVVLVLAPAILSAVIYVLSFGSGDRLSGSLGG